MIEVPPPSAYYLALPGAPPALGSGDDSGLQHYIVSMSLSMYFIFKLTGSDLLGLYYYLSLLVICFVCSLCIV